MKKTIFAIMLLMSVAFSISSCSKDEKSTKELLVGKWYFQKLDHEECFNKYYYLEIDSDGSFVYKSGEREPFPGTYIISEDDKTISVKIDGTDISITILMLDENNLKFKLNSEESYQVELSKIAGTCTPT